MLPTAEAENTGSQPVLQPIRYTWEMDSGTEHSLDIGAIEPMNLDPFLASQV